MQHAKYSVGKAVAATNMSIKTLALCSPVSNTEGQFSTESLGTCFCLTGQKNSICSKKHTFFNTRYFSKSILQEHNAKLHTVCIQIKPEINS